MPEKVKELPKQEWIEMTEEVFTRLFEKSALKRAGYNGLMRNVRFAESRQVNE
jgi:epoxyqueuosine reductase